MKKLKFIFIVGFILLVAASLFAYFNHYLFIYRVESNQTAVERFLGRYSKTTGPGLHLKFPYPITKVDIVNSATIRQVELGFKKIESDSSQIIPDEALIFTGDEKIVSLAVAVQYRIGDPKKYLLSITDREEIIKNSCKAAVRNVVGRYSIDEILTTGKPEIEREITNKINMLWNLYSTGLELLSVQLQSADPPSEVSGAFKDVTNAREDRNTYINEAIAYRENEIPLARAQAFRIIEQSKAYFIQRTKKAEGEAEAFALIHSEYSKNREMIKTKLYLEMLEEVLPGIKVYVSDNNSGNVNLLNLNK